MLPMQRRRLTVFESKNRLARRRRRHPLSPPFPSRNRSFPTVGHRLRAQATYCNLQPG